jgi:hypothetical protein
MKISRKKVNEDLMNILLTTSDPLISSIRGFPPQKIHTFSVEAKRLIKFETDNVYKSDTDDSTITESDSE